MSHRSLMLFSGIHKAMFVTKGSMAIYHSLNLYRLCPFFGGRSFLKHHIARAEMLLDPPCTEQCRKSGVMFARFVGASCNGRSAKLSCKCHRSPGILGRYIHRLKMLEKRQICAFYWGLKLGAVSALFNLKTFN